jgi:hypothetical protein
VALNYLNSQFVWLTDLPTVTGSRPVSELGAEPDRNNSTKTVSLMIKPELIKVFFVAS